MRKMIFFMLLALVGFNISGFTAAEPKSTIGIVNFSSCIMDSKLGKQEQASFEGLKKQMGTLLEDTEKQINELATQFNDREYMDSISPEDEEQMKNKYRALGEEMNRYHNQYYQVLNQANMKMLQTLGASIQEASEKVAKNKKLSVVLNKEALFFYTTALDVTSFVITEMDKEFDLKAVKNQTAASTPAPAGSNAAPTGSVK